MICWKPSTRSRFEPTPSSRFSAPSSPCTTSGPCSPRTFLSRSKAFLAPRCSAPSSRSACVWRRARPTARRSPPSLRSPPGPTSTTGSPRRFSAVSDPSRKRGGLPMQVKMRHDNHFVEELAARHETPVGKMVPLSAIEPDPNQPRTSLGDLDDLVASIRSKGVLEPILIRPRPLTEGNGPAAYRIISGERRFRASQEAGLYEVPAIEMDVSEEEALEIALIENLQRKDLTPFEEAEGFRQLAELHGSTAGA